MNYERNIAVLIFFNNQDFLSINIDNFLKKGKNIDYSLTSDTQFIAS